MAEPRDSTGQVVALEEGGEALRAPTALPRELIYFYLVAPVLLTPVLQRNIFELSPRNILRSVAGNYVPFLFIPVAVHLVHRFVLPRVWPRASTLLGRFAMHAGVSGIVAASVALVMHPFFLFISNGRTPKAGFLSSCVILTWMFILPALVVQELRDRAEAIGRRLSAERQATLRAQLEAIQSRTNPHFLFNALNTVASLVRDEPELAERTIEHLADFLRYALQSGRLQSVALGREIAMLEDYLEVQRARFGERLTYAIEVEPGLAELMLPPLLLQPLVENAVLHGVAGRAEGGSVRLAIRRGDQRIEFSIEDDGPGPGASTHRGSSTSLRDLERRLAILYGPGSALAIGSNDRGGFSVGFSIPERARA